MKKIVLTAFTLTLFLFACSESKDPIQERNETLKKNFTTYIARVFSQEEKQNVSVDSIEIVKVDSLTEQVYIAMKMNMHTPQFNNQIKLVELDASQLENAKAFSYDEQTINQLQEKFNEDNQKMEAMAKENNALIAALDKADNKKFKCYLVTMKIHVTEKGASRIFNTALHANEAFEPIDMK